MDYNLGDTSPDPYGGGGGSIHLVCDHCGTSDNYNTDDADDGQFTCRTCSAVHTTQATAADPHYFPVTGSISVRRVATQPTPKLGARTPAPYPRTPQAASVPAAAAFDDFMELSEPRDFAPGSGTWGEPEDLAVRVRWRYVRGLQVILQRQLEVLVERHQVGATVCAVAGIVWVRWVAASGVFDGIWVHQVLEDHKAMGREKCSSSRDNKKPDEVKYESDDDMLLQRKDRRKVEFAFLRSLRMMLPVYSTLAVCFLACHIAREAILPNDIYRWAMEGNVPYVAAFTEVDRFLGSSFQDCPLDARQLFRPVRVIGAWQLEAAVGSIAQKVGLRLPSVNFYAIAHRCLKDLLLPIDRILPHACRIYEWAMPAELWLSSNPARVPTRVCVMAILIVALRLLYNINGQGIWEKICEEGRNTSESHHDTNSSTSRKLEASNNEEFGTRELLCAIAAAYDKINTTHDYSSDLRSYLKYCKEVIFTGITFSDEENHLIEIFWDMYKARECRKSSAKPDPGNPKPSRRRSGSPSFGRRRPLQLQMATTPAYKLQEFVAHASNVNCAKFGRRTSRILITGGEDLKVNLWAVGKPSALLSLSGFTSPVESVSFDSSEVTIGAGAASGTIKIWNIEEAKVVRTFTGHRSNCASLDFHPFGEFLASGSSDTNMKIWDTRKKRCIHTYKGHTRRINVLKFTPDGRWIVSGGADNSVKVWDLTAGKLMHDFRLHEGPVNCLDVHPHEFLLATGSVDKTLKFWDLETFELIGSSGPENSREYFEPASVIRSMKFNSDGKTIFCGLHESLKVLSWEPIICHDVVDVGWSTLADLTVDEQKLLGCSYNQNCVSVWVVDLMRNEPYVDSNSGPRLNGSVNRLVESDDSMSSVFGRLSVSRSPANEIGLGTLLGCSMSASKEISVSTSASTKGLSKPPGKRDLQLTRSVSTPLLSPRVRLNPNFIDRRKNQPAAAVPLPEPIVRFKANLSSDAGMLSRSSHASEAPMYRSRSTSSRYGIMESSSVPVLTLRHSPRKDAGPVLSEAATVDLADIEPQNIEKVGLAANHGKEDGKLVPVIVSRSSKMVEEVGCRRITNDVGYKKVTLENSLRVNSDIDYRRRAPESQEVQQLIPLSEPISSSQRKFTRESSGAGDNNCSGLMCTESVESNEVGSWYSVASFDKWNPAAARNPEFASIHRNEVVGISQLMESSGKHAVDDRPSSSDFDSIQYVTTPYSSRLRPSLSGKLSASASDEDDMSGLMENHQEFIHVMKSRLTKLEVVYRFWQRNDIKGSIDATWRMLDFAVTTDIVNALMENRNCITLDVCASLLCLTASLLESTYDRHMSIALGMILSLVESFGSTISSALSATPPVGVDLEAEQRLERCNLCFQELKNVSTSLKFLTRRQGEVGRSAQELNLFLQDIFQLSSSV